MLTKKLTLKDDQEALLLLGEQDAYLRRMEAEHGVEIFVRHEPDGQELHLSIRGTASRVQKAFRRFKERLDRQRAGTAEPTEATAPLSFPAHAPPPKDAVYVTAFGKAIKPRSQHQKEYVDSMLHGDMTFAIGPAGTGKTYLAVACALRMLKAHDVSRIVLTRPVVEAGEKLGFLPGDFYEKVHPYLKPLYDAFYAMLGPDKFRMWRDDEIVEIIPLAYMRGRTLENAFIILDEAQNTTPGQMKMFLTRMGASSRVAVTGDITQIDLDHNQKSGLVVIEEVLKSVPGVSFIRFTEEDVVRHALVREIIRAFDIWEKAR